jgi:hypothetical protein
MNKLKHLDFIQDTISRMAGHSFLLKGWSITLIAGIFALSARDSNHYFITLVYYPTILFWFLDGYFLQQERLYRSLYDEVRKMDEIQIDFSMNTDKFKKLDKKNTWLESTFCSKTVGVPYTILILTLTLVLWLVIKK